MRYFSTFSKSVFSGSKVTFFNPGPGARSVSDLAEDPILKTFLMFIQKEDEVILKAFQKSICLIMQQQI